MIIDGAYHCPCRGECLDCQGPDPIDLTECADCHGPADHVYMLDVSPVGLCRSCDPDGAVVDVTLGLVRAGVLWEDNEGNVLIRALRADTTDRHREALIRRMERGEKD